MNEKGNTKPRATLLEGSRADLAAGALPRCPTFPPSNYTYAKRAEAMRAEAEAGRAAQLGALIQLVTGSNTYARATRAYGKLLLEHLDRAAQLDAAIAAAEAEVAQAVTPKPKKAAKTKEAA